MNKNNKQLRRHHKAFEKNFKGFYSMLAKLPKTQWFGHQTAFDSAVGAKTTFTALPNVYLASFW